MSPIRVGIIGLPALADPAMMGAWGATAHLRSFQALPGLYEIVAVANSSVESSQRSIDFHKLPPTTKAYGTAEDIAADPNVDLVVVSVKVPHHYALTKPALEHKKDVFVEWPLGANSAEAQELTNLALANGVRAVVGLQARMDPLTKTVKGIIESGKIGQILSSHATMTNSFLPVDAAVKGAKFLLDFKNGLNIYTTLYAHVLDNLTYFHGEFAQLQGLLKSHHSKVPVMDPATGDVLPEEYSKTAPDHILAQGTLKNGVVASVVMRSTTGAADKFGVRWYITGTKGEVVITTEEGMWQCASPATRSVKLRIGQHGEPEDIDFSGGDQSVAAKLSFPAANTCRLHENFAKTGGEVVSFADALKLHQLLDKITTSAGWP